MRIVVFLCLCFSLAATAGENDKAIERELFVFHASTTQFIEPIESALLDARVKLIEILHDSLSYKPDIYMSDNLADFKKLIGTAFPDWGAAAALPYRSMIALKSPANFPLGKPLRELVMHEYAHLALSDRIRPMNAPRWLDEGVAMYTAAEWGWQNNLSMGRAALFGEFISLYEIEDLNRFSEGQASVAYAQSYLAVKYLLDNYGPESFNILLDGIKSRRPIDDALTDAIGGTYREFEKEFNLFLNDRYNWGSIFMDTYFLWIFLALVVFIGFMLQRRKKQKYYKKWAEDEKYQSTDFDYGDPDNPEKEDDEDKPWA